MITFFSKMDANIGQFISHIMNCKKKFSPENFFIL